MNDLQFLWASRERPPVGSRRWLVVWAKRALQFRALMAMLYRRRRFRARGVQIGSLSVLDSPALKGSGTNLSVGERSFIAGSAEIVALDKVTIGYGAVVGAGAVVSRDVPPLAVATGNPASVRLDARSRELHYDPVILLAPYEAWVGRSEDAPGTSSDGFPSGESAPVNPGKSAP